MLIFKNSCWIFVLNYLSCSKLTFNNEIKLCLVKIHYYIMYHVQYLPYTNMLYEYTTILYYR